MAVSPGGFVALDCADPLALGEFWAAMLGGDAITVSDDIVAVRTPWVWLTALRVDDHRPPSWPAGDVPKQIHLDLAVADLNAAAVDAERLGARTVADQPAPDRWLVLTDPAGHPFCLTTQIPVAMFRPDAPPPAQEDPVAPRQFFGKYAGTVVDNADPTSTGRVRVTVPAVTGPEVEAWALPCFAVPGVYAVPAVGADVWVEFEAGNAGRPIWTGCWFPTGGEAPSPVIATAAGGVVITAADGATITLDERGIVIDNAKGARIVLAGPTVDVNAGALAVT